MSLLGAGMLVAAGAVITIGEPASAHTLDVNATCSNLNVNLTNYAASQPGKDAVDEVYKDWDETVHHDAVGTPTITIDNPDYQPATDAQPGSYDKFTWKGNHGTPTAAPPGNGWHEVGPTSDVKGNTSDTILRAGGGNSYFYFKTVKAPVAAQPAVGDPTVTITNPDYVAPFDEVIHHHDLVSPGQDAVPAKTNHVMVTDNGTTLANTDFSTSYVKEFLSSDKTITHDYVVTVTSLDGIGAGVVSKHVDVCETPTPVVTDTPPATTVQPPTTTVQSPAPAQSVTQSATPAVSSNTLADTGSNIVGLVWLAIGVIIVGLVIWLVLFLRRRNS